MDWIDFDFDWGFSAVEEAYKVGQQARFEIIETERDEMNWTSKFDWFGASLSLQRKKEASLVRYFH